MMLCICSPCEEDVSDIDDDGVEPPININNPSQRRISMIIHLEQLIDDCILTTAKQGWDVGVMQLSEKEGGCSESSKGANTIRGLYLLGMQINDQSHH